MDEKNLNETTGDSDDTWEFDATGESTDSLEPAALDLIKRTIAKNFERYARWVCQAASGIEDPALDNPLLVRKEGGPVPLAPFYSDVARVLLEALTGQARPAERSFEGYWSIADWIAYKVTDARDLDPVNVEEYHDDVGRGFLIRDFFHAQMSRFEYMARYALVLVHHGVPLYRLNDAGTSLELLPHTHDDYVYLYKKGQHHDPVGMDEFPFWTKTYYFKLAHLEAEKLFFKEDADGEHWMDLSAEQIAGLRDAYCRYIGVQATHGKVPAPRSAHSSLLNLIPKVLERYYGPSYVATDPDTWTTQQEVMKWLMSTFKISAREAAAIDIVTRPDHARRRSR